VVKEHKKASSAGHKLGQIIGDWWEEYFAVPIVSEMARRLKLYADHRFKKRTCRGERLIWKDSDDNEVDYDFVLELGGKGNSLGTPVAFFETFWRRGSRHSKDKARDDSGKLLPMKTTYPTARVLGIIAAGDFTTPARELLRSRAIDLFYVAKSKIVEAWLRNNLTIDYGDKSPEAEKAELTQRVVRELEADPELYRRTADTLRDIVGNAEIDAYMHRVIGRLGATPQSYQIIVQSEADPYSFSNYQDVDGFLRQSEPDITVLATSQYYSYEVGFADGDTFFRDHLTWKELRSHHKELKRLILHMESVNQGSTRS